MAHANYNCCAVCDSRMEYSRDATTKETLCPDCAVELSIATGIKITGRSSLMAWMNEDNPEDVLTTLVRCGFHTCIYENDVDAKFHKLLFEEATGLSTIFAQSSVNRITEFLWSRKTKEWDAIQGFAVHGITIWQAVIAVNPTFTRVGRKYDYNDNMIEDWTMVPTTRTLVEALLWLDKSSKNE